MCAFVKAFSIRNEDHKGRLVPFLLGSILLHFLPVDGSDASGGGNDGEADTARKVDMASFFKKHSLSIDRLRRMEESIQKGNDGKKSYGDLRPYLESPAPSKQRIIGMIDSLLDGEKVDRDRMRGIRILIAKRKARRKTPFLIRPDDAPYPASSIFQNWNTRDIAPYSRKMEVTKRKIRLVAPQWNCGFRVPVDGEITSSFGLRNGKQHAGVDLDLHRGDPVRAAFSGMIRVTRYFKGYGRTVVIRHPNGLESVYAHLHRDLVETGERVEAGERIGTGGSTGHSTGSHLHFEVRYRGIPIDPAHLISFSAKRLRGDTVVLKEEGNRVAAYPAGTVFHEVEKGEHLYSIAQHYGISIRELCRLNDIHRNSTLWVGQRLRISH
ncbi:MAG: peptidoglycan DD-metalloendopeptidase family protein [Flavobacteriales bacterium]